MKPKQGTSSNIESKSRATSDSFQTFLILYGGDKINNQQKQQEKKKGLTARRVESGAEVDVIPEVGLKNKIIIKKDVERKIK